MNESNRNLVFANRDQLGNRHYVQRAAANNNYWVAFHQRRLNSYLERSRREGYELYLIIFGGDEPQGDFYIFPYSLLQQYLTDETLANDSNTSQRRWVWSILPEHRLRIWNAGEVDATRYYGNIDLFNDALSTEGRTYTPTDVQANNGSDSEKWLQTLRRYLNEGTVFHSLHRDAQYAIDTMDDTSAMVSRLTANDPVDITVRSFDLACDRLRQAGGTMPFNTEFANTVAVRTAFLQAPQLALSPDRHTICIVQDERQAAELLCEYIESLNVVHDGDTPRLYQPALLACILDAIDEGEIMENKIQFRPLVERFIRRTSDLGQEGGAQQAGDAFKDLANQPFWLLSYTNLTQVALPGTSLTPAQIDEQIAHASFKEPFWTALQDDGLRAQFMGAIEGRWWSHSNDQGGELPGEFFRSCARFLQIYPERPATYSANSPQHTLVQSIAEQADSLAVRRIPSRYWKADSSSGLGNWATTPWVALFDTRETDGAGRGVYPVVHFLFDGNTGSPNGEPGLRIGIGVSVTEYSGQERESRVAEVAGDLASYASDGNGIYWIAGSDEERPTIAPGRAGTRPHQYYQGMALERFVAASQLEVHAEELEEEFAELLKAYKTWVDRRELIEPERELAGYTQDDALRELFVEPEKLTEILNLLRRKKNLVLQGPPGVGKTFFARRLAYLLTGAQDQSKVETVQFHQSYSYEDFIQGFRPSQESSNFELTNGIFYRFCLRAKEHPGEPYVIIIDEINRGNLSKILGELMMLVEADKRGRDYAIPLTYAREDDIPFYVPENLFIIGTMNTADRSLALVDYALRRRFVFVDREPEFQAEAFAHHLDGMGISSQMRERIISRMTYLNEEVIAEDGKSLGPGYRIGHSFFCVRPEDGQSEDDWYRQIVNYEIKPLLAEYWFDNREKVVAEVERLVE